MRGSSNENGFALITVIAIFLVLSMVGLLFIHIIRTKLASETDRLMSYQSKYLARSSIQMALLEIQFKTELTGNVRKKKNQIELRSSEGFPESGWILLGETDSPTPYSFSRTGGKNALLLDPPLEHNVPAGTSVYLLQDYDGNGEFGSIAKRNLENGKIEVTIVKAPSQSGLESSLVFMGKATVGSAQTKIECAIIFP